MLSRELSFEANEMKIVDRLLDTFTGARRIRGEAGAEPSDMMHFLTLVRARVFLAITGRQLVTEASLLGQNSVDSTTDDLTRLSPLRRLRRD